MSESGLRALSLKKNFEPVAPNSCSLNHHQLEGARERVGRALLQLGGALRHAPWRPAPPNASKAPDLLLEDRSAYGGIRRVDTPPSRQPLLSSTDFESE